MTLRHRLDVLALYDPDRSSSTVNVWVSRPTPGEEQALGTLFCLISIDGSERMYHEMISLIQEELRTSYYSQMDHQPEAALEQCLQKTNARLHQLILEGLGQWIEQAHMLVGVLVKQQLLLTAIGSVHAYVVRRDRLHDILGERRVAPINPIRVFDHIVAGHVESDDRLLFCTPSLLDYFSLEKLRRTVLDHEPSQAVRTIETTLLGVDRRTAFGAIVMDLAASEVPSTATPVMMHQPRKPGVPQISMNELVNRERDTQKLLSPSVWPAVRDVGQQIGSAVDRFVRTSVFRQPPRRFVSGATPARPPRVSSISSWLEQTRRWLAPIGQRLRNRTGKLTTEPPVVRLPFPNARRTPWWSFTGILNSVTLWFQRLGARQRLAVGIILVLLLAWSTAVVRTGSLTGTAGNSDTNTVAQSIDAALAQAEAALLYGGDDIAQEKLTQAKTLLEDWPSNSRSGRAQRQALADKITGLEQRVSRITVVTPSTLLDVATVERRMRPAQLYLIDDRLIAADPASGLVVSLSRQDGKEHDVFENTLDTGKLKTGTPTTGTHMLFSTERSVFVDLDIDTGDWKPIDARFPRTNPEIQSISFFQNRLYVLDITNNSIVRFALGTNSLGSGANWLRSETNLRAARTAIVDGSIYVLQPGGQVELYFSGRPSEFTIKPITPTLTDATRLFTDEASQNIYLLDPAGRRVVVFSKQGSLIQQYTATNWTSLRDVIADETEKKLYILNGTTVQTVPFAAL